MTGQSTRIPLLGHALKYGNTEEFFAILVSNIYISEMGGTKFRGDNDSAVLRPELTSIGAFFGDSDEGKSNRIALRLTKIDPVVFGKLARVRSAPFNPIRDIVIQSKLTHAVKSVKSLELRELLPSYLR